MIITTSGHSKYLIKYHLILVCKYRKNLLEGRLWISLKAIIEGIVASSDFTIEIMEPDKNHLHILLSSPPKLSPLSMVNRLKSITTKRIWETNHNLLYKEFWKEKTFWSDGYFISSIGNASIETIKKYIAQQG